VKKEEKRRGETNEKKTEKIGRNRCVKKLNLKLIE
jgi:hypothetical protein